MGGTQNAKFSQVFDDLVYNMFADIPCFVCVHMCACACVCVCVCLDGKTEEETQCQGFDVTFVFSFHWC